MGEFNVNKTTGELNPTAGMHETYPAEQVMMSDGVTSVEDALGIIEKFEYKVIMGTTDANGFLTTGLLARHYMFMGTVSTVSLFVTPINARSDGIVRLRFTDGSGNPYANDTVNIGCIFAKVS